ncbi:MAG: hypothetical protein Q8M16_24185, partial [Pirellulaceae bacterium]|nr:hypothetical protein [Pirellulaceae bacterium]
GYGPTGLASVNRCGLGWSLFAKQVCSSTASLAFRACVVVVNPGLHRGKLGGGPVCASIAAFAVAVVFDPATADLVVGGAMIHH